MAEQVAPKTGKPYLVPLVMLAAVLIALGVWFFSTRSEASSSPKGYQYDGNPYTVTAERDQGVVTYLTVSVSSWFGDYKADQLIYDLQRNRTDDRAYQVTIQCAGSSTTVGSGAFANGPTGTAGTGLKAGSNRSDEVTGATC